MSNLALLSFDELPRGAGGAGATERIARVLTQAGIDAPSSLYDEALDLAQDGRLAAGAERLRMLLCLDPNDADAALLLAKVQANRGQWQDALIHLDLASANGAVLPPGLRENVEANLRRQVQEDEEQRARIAARERGEIRNLRTEAKRLRSDNASMELQLEELSTRVKLWSSATAIVTGASAALLLASLLFGGGTPSPDEIQLDDASAAITVEAPPTATTVSAPTVSAPTVVAPVGVATAPVPANNAAVQASVAAAAPASIAPTAKPAAAKAASSHKVQKGDNLGRIAAKYYGNAALWPKIQAANKDSLKNGVDLTVGQTLVIPPR
jgi:nucleoid-associated protein YgaU